MCYAKNICDTINFEISAHFPESKTREFKVKKARRARHNRICEYFIKAGGFYAIPQVKEPK